MNYAHQLTGMQIGVINMGPIGNPIREVKGVVNRSDSVTGIQIGLLNMTENPNGFQIGLLNYVGNNSAPFKYLPLFNAHLSF